MDSQAPIFPFTTTNFFLKKIPTSYREKQLTRKPKCNSLKEIQDKLNTMEAKPSPSQVYNLLSLNQLAHQQINTSKRQSWFKA